jgi:hypothetical protein
MRIEAQAWAERAADAEDDAALVQSLMVRGIVRLR